MMRDERREVIMLPPSWGTCFVDPSANGDGSPVFQRRSLRRPRESRTTTSSFNGAAVLVQVGNECFLCRLVPAVEIPIQKDSIIRFDTSIRVEGPTIPSGQEGSFPLDVLRQEGNDPASSSRRAQFCLSEREAATLSPSGFVQPLNTSAPIPILSLRLKEVSRCYTEQSREFEESNRPLLDACLKRYLVGALLLFQKDKWKTTFSMRVPNGLNKKEFFVESLTFNTTSTAARSSDLYIILPSTRITLIPSSQQGQDPTSIPRHANQQIVSSDERLQLSPASQLLFDTMDIIYSHQMMTNKNKQKAGDIPVLPPRCFLLTGPPGVGKTFAVRSAVNAMLHKYGDNPGCVKLTPFSGSSLLGESGHLGGAAIKLQEEFAANAGRAGDETSPQVSVLFLDEAEALVATSLIGTTLALLLDRMNSSREWGHLILIAATNRMDSIPDYLRRPGRLDREIPLAPPNAKQRADILKKLLLEQAESVRAVLLEETNTFRDELVNFADACVGYVPADLAALVRRAIVIFHSGPTDSAEDIICARLLDCLHAARKDVGASALRDAALKAPPATTWDDIAGDPGSAKTALRQAIEWPRTHQASFKALGLIPPRGVLLHGPPGCAKTSLARAAAGASGVAFLSLSPAEVYASSYVGEAEAVVRRAFSLARSAAPCVLFFDEIDSIIGVEGGSDGHGMARGNTAEARVLSTFLNEMDGVDIVGSLDVDGVLVLAATNRPWTLDAALLRPGRFDKIIHVPPPDQVGRRAILELETRSWPLRGHLDLDLLSSKEWTESMTGAEIVGACREAVQSAMREALASKPDTLETVEIQITQLHLEIALQQIRPLLADPSVAMEYSSFEMNRG